MDKKRDFEKSSALEISNFLLNMKSCKGEEQNN